MKKYFAKYLPVEGEIKEGDWFIRSDEPYGPFKSLGKGIADDAKKVELFLCSRDIQVGDKVFIPAMSRANQKVPDVSVNPYIDINSKEELELFKKAGAIKIIGETSPDATWVKEGDEFEDGDIQYMPRGERVQTEENPNGTYNVVYKFYRIVQIKGSCGHFH